MVIKDVNLQNKVEILKKFNPFNLLGENLLYKVAASLGEEFYPAGTYVGRQGETSRHVLFLVVEGKAEITVSDKNGHEFVTGYRGPYEFMGETVFFSGEEYPASARAVTDTRCFVLPQEIFEEIIIENPDFAAFFTRLLTERLRILYQKFFNEDDLSQDQGFGKRISDIMVSNVVTCLPGDDVRQIASIMSGKNVSSVIVADKDKPLGIITEGDLVSKILLEADLQKSAGRTARELMSTGLITVKPQDFSYQAFLLMVKYRIKHVIVVDGEGSLVGIVAMRDVIKSRKTGSLAVVNSIESSSTIEELCKLSSEVDQVLQALLVERATVIEITSLITEFYDRITRKVIQISERAMIEEGYGPPPVSYCWITMGSSGRKEQYARTDQDNGIIYEDVTEDKEEKVKNYFLMLGEKVVAGLEQYGFRRCKGMVMANNEEWCRSFRSWRDTIKDWINSLLPQNVRLMTIFLDFRYLYGKKSLYDLLRNFVVRNFRNSFVVLNFLVQDNLGKKVPINIFRQVQTERSGEHRNELNLKTSACVHVVDCARVFALREGLLVTNTFERLEEIGKRNILKEKDIEYITSAYETLMMLRIRDAMAKMRKSIEPDNYINPRELTNREYSLLREALVMVSRLQGITDNHFRIMP
jgi:CBS domain-containing protein